MIKQLQNRYYGDFTFFSFVTRRNFLWQNLVIVGLLTTSICSFGFFMLELTNHTGDQLRLPALTMVSIIVAGTAGRLYHAQTIKLFFPQYYISKFSWCRHGIAREMKYNFEQYNKVSGESASDLYQAIRASNRMRKKRSNKLFNKFEYLYRGTVGIFIGVMIEAYTVQFPSIILLFLLTEGFLWCFKICWADSYENIFTDIGDIDRFLNAQQRIDW